MSEFNSNDKKRNTRNNNNNNIYWIYGALLALFLLAWISLNDKSHKATIKDNEFARLVETNHIEEVDLVGQERIDIYLNSEGIKAAKDAGKELAARGPHYQLIVNESTASDHLVLLKDAGIPRKVVQERDYSIFYNILIPIALLVALWFFFMRRVGGGGPGGQIFNIGKSRASLYDKENKVNVTFDDVAGLEEAKEEGSGSSRIS